MNAPSGFEDIAVRDLRFSRLRPRFPIGDTAGVTRAELTVPVSPTGAISDAVLYEDAANAAVQLHLPKYRLREQGPTYDVTVTALPTGRWAVRIGLDAYPSPDLGDAGRTSAPLPFRASACALVYSAPPVSRRIEAAEIAPDERGYLVTFDLDLPGKDEVLWAIASDAGATVVLSRTFDIAVPTGDAVTAPVGAFEVIDGDLKLLEAQVVQPTDITLPQIFVPIEFVEPPVGEGPGPGPEPDHVVVQPEVVEPVVIEPAVTDLIMQPAFLESFAASSVRAFAAPTARAARLRAPLVRANLPLASLRASVLQQRTVDRGLLDLVIDPGPVVAVDTTPDAVQRYRQISPTLDADILLKIDPAVHPAVFGGVATTAPSYTAVRVLHPATGAGARSHVYFQDAARPHVFLHLPDEYRLARTESLPLRPALVFRVDQGESASAAVVSLTARLRPVIDPERLRAAATQLDKLVPPPLPGQEKASVVLEPVQADATLALGLPPDAESVALPLDLVNGFVVEVRLPYASFQDVFAALASGDEVGTLLRGTVTVDIGTGEGAAGSTALVPVDVRFATAGGDVLTVDDAPTADGAIALSLRNASESPVRIDALPLRIARAGGDSVEGVVEGVVFPLELPAGGALALAVRPAEPLTGDGEPELFVDLSRVVPLPDAQAILALTLDQSVAQLSARTVTVRTTAGLLGGDDPVEELFVEFEGGIGDPPVVNAAQLQATARIPVPLVDVLLRRPSGPYRFRQIAVRASGAHRDAEWRTSDSTLLIVPEK